ncbi:MAG: sulfurtransferase TusA family protein [Proteobacteria bacterium]|nr:sulfurtransferase TusA family protein [Pseudomonadota bacterium]
MNTTLDTKGHQCPIPVLKARRAIKEVAPGDTLTVLATDPASVIDFKHFCNTTGNELVEWTEDGDVFTYVIRRTA